MKTYENASRKLKLEYNVSEEYLHAFAQQLKIRAERCAWDKLVTVNVKGKKRHVFGS